MLILIMSAFSLHDIENRWGRSYGNNDNNNNEDKCNANHDGDNNHTDGDDGVYDNDNNGDYREDKTNQIFCTTRKNKLC